MKLFIALPVYQGLCHIKFMESVCALLMLLKSYEIDFHYFSLTSESLISRGRNVCATAFFKSDCTHMMFIDSDIIFDPSDVIRFLKLDKNILCAAYPNKILSFEKIKENIEKSSNMKDLLEKSATYCIEKSEASSNLCIADYGQTGFMMVKKNVFESIFSKHKNDISYVNDIINYEKYSIDNEFYNFYQVGISNGKYLSEDYGFCELARDSGFDIIIDCSIKLTHIGQFFFHG